MFKGDRYYDDFFGEVEIYWECLQVILFGMLMDVVGIISLEVCYQGCVDVGVCYLLQKCVVQVMLFGGVVVFIVFFVCSGVVSLFNNLLVGVGNSGGLCLLGVVNNSQVLLLLLEQVFGFDVIVSDGNILLLCFSLVFGYYLYCDCILLKLEGSVGVFVDKLCWLVVQLYCDEYFGDVLVYFNQVEVLLLLCCIVIDVVDSILVVIFQGCQIDGICYLLMICWVKLLILVGKFNVGIGQVLVYEEFVNVLCVVGVLCEFVSGLLLCLLLIVFNDGNVIFVVMGGQGVGNEFVIDVCGDNVLCMCLLVIILNLDCLFVWVLLLVLVGGLVLNLMFCVLLILLLKVLSLVQSGESFEWVCSYVFWYMLGVLVVFVGIGVLMVGLCVIGNVVGIGFQLQYLGVVVVLVYIMFVVGLSLFGVFIFGGGIGNFGQLLVSCSGLVGDFFIGVLVCVVGSVCVGLFMGGVIVYVFIVLLLKVMIVFLFFGLGLVLLFLLIGFVLVLVCCLFKFGLWMEMFKYVLVFLMYVIVLWLLWVLGKQCGVDGMVLVLGGLLLFVFGLWLFECNCWIGLCVVILFGVLLVIGVLVLVWGVIQLVLLVRVVQVVSDNVVEYLLQLLDCLCVDNCVVFVNMIVDWCVSCKVNECVVLLWLEFKELFKCINVVYMCGDYINVDLQIIMFLEEYKVVGVLLYVVYGFGVLLIVLLILLIQVVVEEVLLCIV